MTQLALDLVARPKDGDELLSRLRELGLRSITECRLTRNRRVMVSYRGSALRVHRGFLDAPDDVWRAIVTLVEGRGRARREAKRVVLSLPIEVAHGPKRREVPHPDDAGMTERLIAEHARLNAERFGGSLGAIAIRVSRRMKRMLGHYSPRLEGEQAEIAIARRHIRRHGWTEAVETLLHEMVHQWQAETGRPLDHGREFRRKAREVGAVPRASRAP